MKNNKNNTVYSYHTFYFPFIWDNSGSISMQHFIDSLTTTGKWNDISVYSFKYASKDKVADYQTLQFFTAAARKSLFGWDEEFVRCLEYSKSNDKVTYCINIERKTEKKVIITDEKTGEKIEKTEQETAVTKYCLNVDGIKLKVYNTGVGILTLETENYNYKDIKSVKEINEYGRRIFAPYFAPETNICDCCATTLGFIIGEKDILSPIASFQPQNEEQCIPTFIRDLFPAIRIIPAIDDRMFVACLVNDAEELKKHLDYEIDETGSKIKNVCLNYKTNDVASKSLYEFVYIDRDDYCSCPTKCMRNSLLERSIYSRWSEYITSGQIAGTLYGITHHSMVCLTSATDEYYIERPFLTIYTHMISVVLAQRASILAFDEKISSCSRDFEKKRTGIKISHIKELKELQDKYIAFLNQHMNIEVTCQEQGIELYKMLQNEMYVCKEEEVLSKELSLLNDAADTAIDIRNNSMAIILTILFGLISALPISKIITYLWEIFKSVF